MSDANKALVRQFYERFNAGDLTMVDDLVADDFVEHEAFPGLEPNKTGLRQLFEGFHAAFRGGKFDVGVATTSAWTTACWSSTGASWTPAR